MKTAVSVPEPVFERAERAADRMGVSRSRLYVMALEQYLDEMGADPEDPVTAALDRVHADDAEPEAGGTSDPGGAAAGRRLIDEGRWEW